VLLSRLRKPIDSYLPFIGRLYRSLRELRASRPHQTPFGFRLAGDSRMAQVGYEDVESALFLQCLETHAVVLDIGANIGFYSCLAASRGKHVLAFEPSPRNQKFLYKNLWENHFHEVELFPLGLGDRQGLCALYGFGGISSFIPGWGQTRASRYILAPVTTLDTIVGTRFNGLKLLVKMDVEGFELAALRGASTLLSATPRPGWMVEIMLRNPLIPNGVNSHFKETFELFWKHGYQCRKLDGSGLSVSPEDVLRWQTSGYVDSDTGSFFFF